MTGRKERVMWKCMILYVAALLAIGILACVRQSNVGTPRPVAYPRIERAYDTAYVAVRSPWNIELNRNAAVRAVSGGKGESGFHVRYEAYGADLYCSYSRVSGKRELEEVLNRRMQRISLDSGNRRPDVYRTDNAERNCHAMVCYTLRDCLTPVHFVATDSISAVVSGTVVLDRLAEFDSIAPVFDYLSCDVAHLVRNLDFRRP